MKVILNGTKVVSIVNCAAIFNGIAIKMENDSVDRVENLFLEAGELEKVELAFDDEIVFGRYYNMHFASISKADGIITVTLLQETVSAPIDIAILIQELKGSIDRYQSETIATQELQDAAIGELADIICAQEEILNAKSTEDTETEKNQEVDI